MLINQSRMNLCNEPQNQILLKDEIEEWVVDVKRVYDIYHKLLKK
jgi:Fe-S cluster biosynthesis and repair protein YggX